MERSERVRGTLRRPNSWGIPLTPTLSAEFGYIRLRPLYADRTRVNPSSIARGERERTESVAAGSRLVHGGGGAGPRPPHPPAVTAILGRGAESLVAGIRRIN